MLRECREKAGLTREEVAAAMNISKDAVKKWETGKAMPVASKLPAIANLYGCAIDDLFADSRPIPERLEDLREKIETGKITHNQAREALGLPTLMDPVADTLLVKAD